MKRKIHLLIGLGLAVLLLSACTVNVNVNPEKNASEAATEAATEKVTTEAATEKVTTEKATTEAAEETTEKETTEAPEETTEKAAEEESKAPAKKDGVADYQVSFERKYESGVEYAVITAADKSGEEVWTVETPHFDVAQLNQVENIGVRDDHYYYVEAGTVKALDLADGSLIWENDSFGGSIAEKASAFDDDGNLYLSGYFGPELFIVDPNGKTKKKIDAFSGDYYWPYEVEFLGDQLAITYEGTPSQQPVTLFIDLYSYTWTGETFGDHTDDQEDAYYDTGVNPEVIHVWESSHLSEPEYGVDHTADSVADKDITTAWCEAAPGQGIGEYVTLEFDKTYPISGVTIYAGFQESDDLYYKNSRPASMTVHFFDGSSQTLELKDERKGQTFVFDSVVETNLMTFVIDSVYEGNKYEDTLITEIVAF